MFVSPIRLSRKMFVFCVFCFVFVFVSLIRLSGKMATRKASDQICAPCDALANGSPRVKSLFGKYVRKSKRGI